MKGERKEKKEEKEAGILVERFGKQKKKEKKKVKGEMGKGD